MTPKLPVVMATTFCPLPLGRATIAATDTAMRESSPATTASSPAIDDKRSYRSSLGVRSALPVAVVWSSGAAAGQGVTGRRSPHRAMFWLTASTILTKRSGSAASTC